MKKISAIIFILLISISSCKKENATSSELIDIDSKASFDSEIESGVSLMFFHASWCSICKEQRPAIQDAAKLETLSAVFFGQVEYEDNTDIVTDEDVSGFPTIVMYNNGLEVERLTSKGHSVEKIEDLLKKYL